MWRKPADAKPSSQSLESNAAVPGKAQAAIPATPPATPSAEVAPAAAAIPVPLVTSPVRAADSFRR